MENGRKYDAQCKKIQKIKTEKHLRMDEDEDEIYIESNRTNVLHIIYLTLLSI